MGNFNHIFYENCELIRILSNGISVLVLLKESHNGVHRCKYPYFVATSQSTLFSGKIMHQRKFYQGTFPSKLFIKALRHRVHRQKISILCCHVTCDFNCIFCNNYVLVQIYEGKLLSQCSSRNHVVQFLGTIIYSTLQ